MTGVKRKAELAAAAALLGREDVVRILRWIRGRESGPELP